MLPDNVIKFCEILIVSFLATKLKPKLSRSSHILCDTLSDSVGTRSSFNSTASLIELESSHFREKSNWNCPIECALPNKIKLDKQSGFFVWPKAQTWMGSLLFLLHNWKVNSYRGGELLRTSGWIFFFGSLSDRIGKISWWNLNFLCLVGEIGGYIYSKIVSLIIFLHWIV